MTSSICYIMPSLYPSGGNKMVVEHVKRLAKRGHFAVVSIVSKHDADDATWLEMEGIKIVDFNSETISKYKHVVATYWETYYNMKALKLPDSELYYFVQSKEEDFETDWWRKQKVLQSLMDKNVHYFTEAKWIKQYLSQTCRIPSVLVPNNIELPGELNLVKKPRNKPIILIEGEATTAWKNILDGARVANLLRPEFDVWLLTNTPYSRINPFIFSSFDKTFSGLSWKEALELIAQADVLYRPSILEGFNGAQSEAMVLGTPTVVNSIPASHEVCINEIDAIMVKPFDIYEAVDKIKRLIKDDELREKIISNGKETAEKYFTNWEKSIDVLEYKVFCE